jgi:copper chaperone
MAQIEDVVLSVPDISCEHCVKTINGTLEKLSGVESVSTDIPTKSVHVRYDQGQLSLEHIEATLDDAGYAVAKGPVQTPRTSGKPLNLL